MKFALMIRGQYRQSEDMVRCHQDDLAMVRRAEALGFDAVGKASHYSATPWHMAQQIPFLAQVAAIAPKLRIITVSCYCRCTNPSISRSNSQRLMS